MAESLMDIKRKIASTKKTGQITQAMQMVSGAKLSQIEKRAKKSFPLLACFRSDLSKRRAIL